MKTYLNNIIIASAIVLATLAFTNAFKNRNKPYNSISVTGLGSKDLAALKVEMIAEATKDANTRAQKIAENAESQVGPLKNANMGVFQIVAQNSSEEYSWGGSFNTTSKRKTATITVKLEYETE